MQNNPVRLNSNPSSTKNLFINIINYSGAIHVGRTTNVLLTTHDTGDFEVAKLLLFLQSAPIVASLDIHCHEEPLNSTDNIGEVLSS